MNVTETVSKLAGRILSPTNHLFFISCLLLMLILPQAKLSGIQSDTIINEERKEIMKYAGEDDPLELFQGRIPGLNIYNYSGHPGEAVTFNIRGVNSLFFNQDPLILLDGIPILSAVDVNFNDIDSIEIIKSSLAGALYGSKGSNGVVLITSKLSSIHKNTIEFSSSFGVSSQASRLDLMDGTEAFAFIEDLNDPFIGDSLLDRSMYWGSGDFVSNEFINTDDLQNIDWQDRLFQTAVSQNYQLAFTGGSEVSNFRISGFYNSNEGTVKASDYSKLGISFNMYRQIKKWLNVTVGFRYASSKKTIANTSGSAEEGGVILSALATPSFLPVTDINGVYYVNPLKPEINNVDANNNGVFHTWGRDIILGSLKSSIEFTDHLSLDLTGAANVSFTREDLFLSTQDVYLGRVNSGYASFNASEMLIWDTRAMLNYKKIFGDNNLNLNGGFVYQGAYNGWNAGYGTGFANDEVKLVGTAADKLAESNLHYYRGMSFLGNLRYNFNEKYFLEGVFRMDGNSRFSDSIEIISDPIKPDEWEFMKQRRWGSSHGLKLGWLVSNESFMENQNLISRLKAEIAYGYSGNDGGFYIGRNYPYYWSTSAYSINPDEDYTEALFPVIGHNVYNLQQNFWEKSSEINLALDLGLINDRIIIGANYYMRNSSDLLLPQSDTTYSNLGIMKADGIELSLNTVNIASKNFKWYMGFNFTHQSNELVSTNSNGDYFEVGFNGISNVIMEDQPAFAIWGLQTDGVFQTQSEVDEHAYQEGAGPGDIRYINQNGDNVIDEYDRVVLGDPNPDVILGFMNSFVLGRFEISAMFTGYLGQEKLNLTRMQIEGLNDWINQSTIALDRWDGPASTSGIHRAATGANNSLISSRFVEDASFVRLKYLTFTYSLPGAFLDKVGIESFRVYVTGRNLWTITNYSGYDPEVSMMGPLNIDYGTYPNSRYLGGGISISF